MSQRQLAACITLGGVHNAWHAAVLSGRARQLVSPSRRRRAAAPEQLLGERCGLAADMYQLGVLLVELTTQRMVRRRGEWSLPRAGLDCPQVGGAAGPGGEVRWRPEGSQAGRGVACGRERFHPFQTLCRLPTAAAALPLWRQEVVELIVACVAQDPRQRPSASEALEVLQRLPAAGEPD